MRRQLRKPVWKDAVMNLQTEMRIIRMPDALSLLSAIFVPRPLVSFSGNLPGMLAGVTVAARFVFSLPSGRCCTPVLTWKIADAFSLEEKTVFFPRSGAEKPFVRSMESPLCNSAGHRAAAHSKQPVFLSFSASSTTCRTLPSPHKSSFPSRFLSLFFFPCATPLRSRMFFLFLSRTAIPRLRTP